MNGLSCALHAESSAVPRACHTPSSPNGSTPTNATGSQPICRSNRCARSSARPAPNDPNCVESPPPSPVSRIGPLHQRNAADSNTAGATSVVPESRRTGSCPRIASRSGSSTPSTTASGAMPAATNGRSAPAVHTMMYLLRGPRSASAGSACASDGPSATNTPNEPEHAADSSATPSRGWGLVAEAIAAIGYEPRRPNAGRQPCNAAK